MLSILSPAKTLDMEAEYFSQTTVPEYLFESQQLIDILRRKSVLEISSIMKLSDKLAELNYHRYHDWDPTNSRNTCPAIYCFKGDVYQGLEAQQFDNHQVQFAQQNLRILSGLYGLLKPLDVINPYRLEMGTSLTNQRGANLYDFWQDTLSQKIQQELQQHTTPAIINLASQEYSKALNFKRIEAPIITPVFKDEKNGVYKIISFYAKKARGMMAAYIIKNQITDIHQLSTFNDAGYYFIGEQSNKNNEVELLFHRDAA